LYAVIYITCILIGGAVGLVARFVYPGPKTPLGFILTIVLGIIGAAMTTVFAHTIGIVGINQLADPISMVIGAVILLFIWNKLVSYGIARDPGATL
jgi:uncharacterized membrane protein YeaQ/YmgE (transglycosylase-associated protein family)